MAMLKCLKQGLELEPEYYEIFEELGDEPKSMFKISKNKKREDKVRLDGRKGPLGTVLYATTEFCIAQFEFSEVRKYLEKRGKTYSTT